MHADCLYLAVAGKVNPRGVGFALRWRSILAFVHNTLKHVKVGVDFGVEHHVT
jgi:hypothetical protein